MHYKRNVTSGKILSGTDGEIRNYCHTKMGFNKFIDKITNKKSNKGDPPYPFTLRVGRAGVVKT